MSKRELADRILQEVIALRRPESMVAETGAATGDIRRPS
jgi:hypothetical protein